MRFRKPIVALTAAGLLALAACGGSDGGDNGDNNGGSGLDTDNLGNTGSGQDPERQGPVEIDGATEGGIVTVYTATGLTTPLDPQDLYFTDTNAVMTGLVSRQLTQYAYDAESGQMILVPDLAKDLGTPNDDFTEWTFTIRDGVKWETGDPLTAEDVARGIIASMDQETFINGPGIYYSNPYFLGGADYAGPYTDPDATQEAVTVEGNDITIKMSKPFPDFPYYGAFPAMGPRPAGADGDPAKYAQRPWSTGPYKIKTWTPSKSLILERNPEWDPATDPGRTAYPDGYEFKAGVANDQIDRLMLADSGDAQTSLTYEDVQAQNYRQFQEDAEDRLVVGGSPCTYFQSPDYRKVTDKKVREAMLWAYPFDDVILAGGLIPGLTAIPANNIMPPGIPGREEYELVEGRGEFETDPEKAKELLAEAGAENFEVKFLWRTDNPINTQVKDVLVKAYTEAGFKATAVPTTEAKFVEDRDNPDSDINLRSYGWCSDWPSGATWIPPIFQSTDIDKIGFGTNIAGFNEPTIDDEINAVFELPAEDQPAAWNELDQKIMQEYLPVIPQYYTGVAQVHGSKVNGHFNDNTLGQPTYKDIWLTQ